MFGCPDFRYWSSVYLKQIQRVCKEKYDTEHHINSQHCPQSNGEAERAVRTLKNIPENTDDPQLALLAHGSLL